MNRLPPPSSLFRESVACARRARSCEGVEDEGAVVIRERDNPSYEVNWFWGVEHLGPEDSFQLCCGIGIRAVAVEPGVPAERLLLIADFLVGLPALRLSINNHAFIVRSQFLVGIFRIFKDGLYEGIVGPHTPSPLQAVVSNGVNL